MIGILKRHYISISLLILSAIIGFVVFMKVSSLDIYLIEYEYKSSDATELPDYAQVDTVFQYKNIICRNFTASFADTLTEQGIRRHELKVYLRQPSEKRVVKIGNELLASEQVRVTNNRFRETQRKKRSLLYWVLFGFFLGILIEFIVSLKKKPSAD